MLKRLPIRSENQNDHPASVASLHLCRNIFDFSSATAERNSTKLHRKQVLIFLYQICVFGYIGKPSSCPGLWLAETFFDFFSETAEQNSKKLHRKQDTNFHLHVAYQVCVFRADRKTKMAARPLMGWDILIYSLQPLNGIQVNLKEAGS